MSLGPAFLLLLVLSSGCKPDRLPGEALILTSEERLVAAEAALTERRPLVWVDDEPVHIDDVDRWLLHGSLLTRTWFHEYASRPDAVAMLVDTLLMAREGELLVPPDDPEIQLHIGLVLARSWTRRALTAAPPSEEEIVAYVSADPSRWRVPPHREVTAFTFDNREAAEAFHEQLEQYMRRGTRPWPILLDQITDEWAEGHPDAPGLHGNLGRVSPVSEHLPETLRRVVFEGLEISTREPFELDDHWVVLWIGVDTPAVDPPDDVVLQRAGARMQADASAALARRRLDELRRTVPVERDEALIARVSAAREQLPGDEDRPTLPRLLSAERIADHPAATLGIEQYEAIEAERRSLGRLVRAREQLERWEAERGAADANPPGPDTDPTPDSP